MNDKGQQTLLNFINNDASKRSIEGDILSSGGSTEFTRMVDQNIQRVEDKYGCSYGVQESMGQIAKHLGEDFKDFLKEFQEMGSEFFRFFHGENQFNTRYFVRDVFITESNKYNNRLLEVLHGYGRTRREGLFGFSAELNEGHVHIIHDCSLSDGTCRCIFKKRCQAFGRFAKRLGYKKSCYEHSISDWYSTFNYYYLQKRYERALYINGTSRRIPTNGKYN